MKMHNERCRRHNWSRLTSLVYLGRLWRKGHMVRYRLASHHSNSHWGVCQWGYWSSPSTPALQRLLQPTHRSDMLVKMWNIGPHECSVEQGNGSRLVHAYDVTLSHEMEWWFEANWYFTWMTSSANWPFHIEKYNMWARENIAQSLRWISQMDVVSTKTSTCQ